MDLCSVMCASPNTMVHDVLTMLPPSLPPGFETSHLYAYMYIHIHERAIVVYTCQTITWHT